MTKPNSLSDAARGVLEAAAAREEQYASAPERLPVAAGRAVLGSLLKAGLLEEIAAAGDQPAWRTGDASERFTPARNTGWLGGSRSSDRRSR